MAGELKDRHEITQAEWDAYDWLEVTTIGGEPGQYTRGLRRTAPPQDGYVYVRAPERPGDTEYRWARAWTW